MTHHIVVGLRHPRPVPSVPADLEVELPARLLHLDVGLVAVLGVEHAVALGRVDGAPAQHSQWPSFTMVPVQLHLDSGHMALESTLKMLVWQPFLSQLFQLPLPPPKNL